MSRPPPSLPLFPYTTLFRSIEDEPGDAERIREELERQEFRVEHADRLVTGLARLEAGGVDVVLLDLSLPDGEGLDRKSTRLNSSHITNSYAVFCLKKKKYRTTEKLGQISFFGPLMEIGSIPRRSHRPGYYHSTSLKTRMRERRSF